MHHVRFSARCQKQECAHCWSSVWILIVTQSRPELQDQTGGIVTQLRHFSEYAFVLRSSQMVKLLHQKKEAGKRCWHKATRLILIETRNISINNLSQFSKSSRHRITFISIRIFNRICLQLETARFSRACGRSLDKHEKATWRSKETTAASI